MRDLCGFGIHINIIVNLAQWHRRVIESHELWTLPIRAGLRAVEAGYSLTIDARNRTFDRSGPISALDKPVISVGNITVGGTGKTPFVVYLIEKLMAAGRRPAVLARGYGQTIGKPNDEELLIRGRFPALPYASHRERERGAELVKQDLPDVYVLDDAFQHRRLKRDLDIVLIDATCPFGFEHLLPRGLLREPLRSLSRASLVVITRTDLVSDSELNRITNVVRGHAQTAPIIHCQHTVRAVEWVRGGSVSDGLKDRRVRLVSAIGNPRAFRHTVESMGAVVLDELIYPDHHAYTRDDLDRLMGLVERDAEQLVVTTEKDAVKLRDSKHPILQRIACVKVAIEFSKKDATILGELLRQCLN